MDQAQLFYRMPDVGMAKHAWKLKSLRLIVIRFTDNDGKTGYGYYRMHGHSEPFTSASSKYQGSKAFGRFIHNRCTRHDRKFHILEEEDAHAMHLNMMRRWFCGTNGSDVFSERRSDELDQESDLTYAIKQFYAESRPAPDIARLHARLSDPKASPLLNPTAGLGASVWRPSADPEPGQYRAPLSSTFGHRISRAHPAEVEQCYLGGASIRGTYLSARGERSTDKTDPPETVCYVDPALGAMESRSPH